MSETQDSQSVLITPGGEAGVSLGDTLKKAEKGDEVYAEFKLDHSSGTYGVEGEVVNITEPTLEDGRTKRRTVTLDADHTLFDCLKLRLLDDTQSAYTTFDDWVEMTELGETRLQERDLDEVVHVEVRKDE